MYDASVATMTHFLGSLSRFLKKALAHAEAKKIDPPALLEARLFPNMFTLIRQVQIVTDHAKGAGARLAGIAVPSFEDNEKTFDQLQARIAKTIDFLGTLKKEQFNDAATRQVSLKVGGSDMTFTGAEYLSRFALPNFHFHMTTAYAILRHNGVELGKGDYMGRT
jgi:uncharacterized protein